MIFDNILFHGVDHLEKCQDGYRLVRLPENLISSMGESVKGRAYSGTGTELRFVMNGSTEITLRSEPSLEAQVAYIVYGSMPGGWQYSSKIIGTENTTIEIAPPPDPVLLAQIHESASLPFSPKLVRLVLPYNRMSYVGVEGDVRPPRPSELPSKTYLAYGSSITHGSLGLNPLYSYPYQVALNLGTDYINKGYAGAAHLEPQIAEYLLADKKWDFMTAELGINLFGEMSVDEFRERASAFLDILAKDSRPILLTDMFTFSGDITSPEKANGFRSVVRELAAGRFAYKCGLEFLPSAAMLSADLVHPNNVGMASISATMTNFIKENLKEGII